MGKNEKDKTEFATNATTAYVILIYESTSKRIKKGMAWSVAESHSLILFSFLIILFMRGGSDSNDRVLNLGRLSSRLIMNIAATLKSIVAHTLYAVVPAIFQQIGGLYDYLWS